MNGTRGGRAIFWGGMPAGILDLSAATVFYAASRRLPWMVRSAVPVGVAYGVAVYFFMNFLLVPLSKFPPRTFDLQNMRVQLVIHIFCVGLPIALAARRFST